MTTEAVVKSPETELQAQKSVQQYIDEQPTWADGTELPSTPMTAMQFRIWALTCAGKFFEGMVVFMNGVAAPLIAVEFHLNTAEQGVVTASSLAGILVGASALGSLADKYGRKRMFIIEMILFTAFIIGLTLSPNFITLVICLFGAGLALGCDYPTGHMVISESIATKARGRLVLSAFAFQSVGATIGTTVGFLILSGDPQLGAWRWMFATIIIPAVAVVIGRLFVSDSPHWLVSKGRTAEAEKAATLLLKRVPQYPKSISLAHLKDTHEEHAKTSSYRMLFTRHNRRATILSSVPWFIQDLSTYGIGIFTPTILAAVLGAQSKSHAAAATIHNDILGAKGSALTNLLFIVGILVAIVLVERAGRIRLQIIGFIGCAVGLLITGLSMRSDGSYNMVLLFAGFTLFYFMTNLGPNAMTYLIAGEVFPTQVRGKGAGFAASFAKIGAVLTAFLFPILLVQVGTAPVLYFLVGTCIVGALVTFFFRIETTGVNLEELGTTESPETTTVAAA